MRCVLEKILRAARQRGVVVWSVGRQDAPQHLVRELVHPGRYQPGSPTTCTSSMVFLRWTCLRTSKSSKSTIPSISRLTRTPSRDYCRGSRSHATSCPRACALLPQVLERNGSGWIWRRKGRIAVIWWDQPDVSTHESRAAISSFARTARPSTCPGDRATCSCARPVAAVGTPSAATRRCPRSCMTGNGSADKWRNRVHLTIGGCLGPCVLANVTMLIFDGRTLYFQSLNNEALVLALLDYIDAMLAADAYLPPPSVLADLHFTGFRWEDRPDGCDIEDRDCPAAAASRDGGAGWVRVPHPGGHGSAGARVGGGATAGGFSARSGVRAQPSQGRRRRRCVPGLRAARRGGRSWCACTADGPVFRAGWIGSSSTCANAARGCLCVPGTDALDPELTALSTRPACRWRTKCSPICSLAGRPTTSTCCASWPITCSPAGSASIAPAEQPRHGIYHPDLGGHVGR